MLKLEDHPTWAAHADSVAGRVRQGDRVAVRLPVLRERVVARIRAAVPEALHVYVPASVDQAERVLLALGTALGAEATAVVDEHLRKSPDAADDVLNQLTRFLEDRPLLVDGWDALGPAGIDRELGLALRPRTDAIRNWLDHRCGLFIGSGRTPRNTVFVAAPKEPPVQLVNGAVQDTAAAWTDLDADPGAYALTLACRALGAPVHDLDVPEPALRAHIVQLLPNSAVRVLLLAATHSRPLAVQHLPPGCREGIPIGTSLGLWAEISGCVVAEPGWSDFLDREMSNDGRRRFHLDLANAFLADFRLDDPTSGAAALSILEAHRHLVAAGDFNRARECWRYGANAFIEAARETSIAHDYGLAAQLYGTVVDAADRGELQMPRQLRGYARHYLHFNRGHGQLESLASTERGYRQALEDWPQNALFWSRLVRVVCFQGRAGAAMSTLDEAQCQVEDHPQKQTFLIARTVRGLLDRGAPLEALKVWGDYEADTPYSVEIEQRLTRALRLGWSTTQLTVESEEPLVFVRPVEVRVVRGGTRWSAEFRTLLAFAESDSPLSAVRDLVRALRNEVSRLVRAYTSDLSPSERMRKRLLLGAVDVLSSRVDAHAAASYWYYGTLHRDGKGQLWLRSAGDRDYWFEVPASLSVVVDDLPHLARVGTDERGVPIGPVLELKPGFRGSDEDLWDAWRKLLAHDG
jgi:hypothetical protein